MRHEENAEALAELLRQNDFPAFVIEPGANPLYRVAVGPYSDVDSALKVKEALKRHGFDTIRTKWNPAPQ
jgi:cell division septation protein DedD